MPETMSTTQSGWEKRINAYLFDNMLEMTKGQVKRLALKIHKRQQAMSTPLDFEQAMRTLGIYSDTTARDAIRNVEGLAA